MSATPIKDFAAELYRHHRSLVSDGLDDSLESLRRMLPPCDFRVEEHPCGADRWTWKVPSRWVVDEAYLEVEGGPRVADFGRRALELVAYSVPVEGVFTWDEIAPRLHVSKKRPKAVPWVFKYYEPTWGFCVSQETYDALPRDKRYRAVIRSRFEQAPGLRLGVGLVHPEGGPVPAMGEVVVSAHLCHPFQANDNASAVAVGVEVARRLAARPLPPGSASVRFLFQPETIGTICHLAADEALIPRLRCGIVLESIGNRATLALQRSWPGGARVDRIAASVLARLAPDHRALDAWHVFSADEKVLNGPGVGVPSIMLHRAPYEEYHTTDDDLSVLDEGMLRHAADCAEEIVRVCAADYVPRRRFRGPVHLSRHGLWVPYEAGREKAVANQKAMLHFEGRESVFDVAEALKVDFWTMRGLIERYREKGLVDAEPAREPSPA